MTSKFNKEQALAISTRQTNLLVSASAGSGKTTVLIERILQHILSGYASIDRLLVVTFTEAAASEMKERMEVSLKQAVNSQQDSDMKRLLVNQMSQLPNASIQTLHAFCLRVIQQFFYLIDIDPNVQLMTDNTQNELIQEEAWESLIEDIVLGERDDLISLSDYLDLLNRFGDGRSDTGLYVMMNEMIQFARSNPNSRQWIADLPHMSGDELSISDPVFRESFVPMLLQYVDYSLNELNQALLLSNSLSTEYIDKYQPFLNNEKHTIERLLTHLQDEDLQALVADCQAMKFNTWPRNNSKDDNKEIINAMKDHRDRSKDSLNKVVQLFPYTYPEMEEIHQKNYQIIVKLSELLMNYYDQFEAIKVKHHKIDYTDLEHLTLDILAPINPQTGQRKPSIAAKYYQDLFIEVMVDEYQDINELQALILSYLSRENYEQGNLFMVGDVKQSIYGFRMAEPSLFLAKYEAYQHSEQGQLIILDRNYRSRSNVLTFTNYIFERLMSREYGEMDYGPQESLVTGNDYYLSQLEDRRFDTELLLYSSESEEVIEESHDFLDGSYEGEAHLIAQHIRQLMNQRATIYDKRLMAERPIEYSDIVLLSATRGSYATVQRVFEQYDIPLYSQKVETYFQRHEIQLILSYLKIIDNPLQDIPLVAILRSYFVGLTDEQLSLIRIASPHLAFYDAVIHYAANESEEYDVDLVSMLRSFLEQLYHFQDLAQEEHIVNLIWSLYIETDFLNYNAGLSNGIQRTANLHGLYQKAKEFEAQQFKGIYGFIRYVEKIVERDNDLAEPALIDENQNYVRMMTVHGSKGLEFPIVYIFNTAKQFNLQDTHQNYIMSKKYGLGLNYLDREHNIKYKTLTKAAINYQAVSRLKAEEMRKLYVALTRSEQKLYIVGIIDSKAKWEEKNEVLHNIERDNLTIPIFMRMNTNNWLEWIQQAIMIDHNPMNIPVKVFKHQDIVDGMPHHEFKHQVDPQAYLDYNYKQSIETTPNTELDQLMHSIYSHPLSTVTSSYQSVSELKRLFEEPVIAKANYVQFASNSSEQERSIQQQLAGVRYTEDSFNLPLFKQKVDDKVSATQRGTMIHYVMQLLDFKAFSDRAQAEYASELIRQVQQLNNQQLTMKIELSTKDQSKIISFLQSSLGQDLIQQHNRLQREKAFSYLVPAETLYRYEGYKNDDVLIHGVIDVYYEVDGQVTLIDYKTNRLRHYGDFNKQQQIEQLKTQYRFQLSLYRSALQTSLHNDNIQVYMVLLDFEEVIMMDHLYSF